MARLEVGAYKDMDPIGATPQSSNKNICCLFVRAQLGLRKISINADKYYYVDEF
jgi:hypothetical protein